MSAINETEDGIIRAGYRYDPLFWYCAHVYVQEYLNLADRTFCLILLMLSKYQYGSAFIA